MELGHSLFLDTVQLLTLSVYLNQVPQLMMLILQNSYWEVLDFVSLSQNLNKMHLRD